MLFAAATYFDPLRPDGDDHRRLYMVPWCCWRRAPRSK
jgi:hypothetical protein